MPTTINKFVFEFRASESIADEVRDNIDEAIDGLAYLGIPSEVYDALLSGVSSMTTITVGYEPNEGSDIRVRQLDDEFTLTNNMEYANIFDEIVSLIKNGDEDRAFLKYIVALKLMRSATVAGN